MQDSARIAPGKSPGVVDLSALSQRERDVLALLCKGYSRAGIAGELFRSPKTIDNHCTRIYSKLGVQSQAQLVSLIYEQGLVKQLDMAWSAEHTDDRIILEDRVFQAIGAIDRRLAGAPSDRFFSELVLGLAEVTGTEMAGVTESDESGGELVVIVASDRGESADQLSVPVETSACGRTYELGECACERDARRVFPDFEKFQVAGIESYAGVRLEAHAFGRFGCLWVADRKPIEDMAFVLDVLRLLRRRVSSELALQIAIDRLDELGSQRSEANNPVDE